MNMVVQIRTKRPLLDLVAEVLVADPSASLAEVAQAAGIGRTTLHNHYATRDELLVAVGHRVLDLWEEAVGKAEDGPDGGLASLTSILLPLCPQLMFLWRNPGLEKQPSLAERWDVGDEVIFRVMRRAVERGVLAPGLRESWLFNSYISLLIAAAGEVQQGRMAPLDAPGCVLRVFLHGIGTQPRPEGEGLE
jgi:AcrR family transcriptional regulator